MGTVIYANVNGQLLSETRDGARKLYSLDPLGNTRALYDNTLTKTDTFDYFPSGTVSSRTGTTPTPFQWVGGQGYYRDNAKRTHVRARNFYVNLGRWAETDPIGFAGGDYNLYRYVQNQFVVMVDPSGLSFALSCMKYHLKFVPRADASTPPKYKVVIDKDYNPLIQKAIAIAERRLGSDCATRAIEQFVLATGQLTPTDSIVQFTIRLRLKALTWKSCVQSWFKPENQGYECDFISKYKNSDKDEYDGGCVVWPSKTTLGYARENTHPIGPITFCEPSLHDGGVADEERINTIYHEIFHICSSVGFHKKYHDQIYAVAAAITSCAAPPPTH